MNRKIRTRRKVHIGKDEDFIIDEDDYQAVREILTELGIHILNWIRKIHIIQEDEDCTDRLETDEEVFDRLEIDDERRVCEFWLSDRFRTVNLPKTGLSTSIGKLTNLASFRIKHSAIASLPPSIGRLKKLTELYINGTDKPCWVFLPEEIGELASLQTLDLHDLCIENSSLPSSIGCLKNLTYLNLHGMHCLHLPEEIGDLTSLNKLNLQSSSIKSLPTSIGCLQNLIELNLCNTGYLVNLPPSIGCLKNLTALNLGWTKLKNLPEEIGDLISLEKLELTSSDVTSLPTSIGRLRNLRFLSLLSTRELLNLPEEFLKLTHLYGVHFAENNGPVAKKFCYSRACNIATMRIGVGTMDANCVSLPLKLWPLVLHHATRAFEPWEMTRGGEPYQYTMTNDEYDYEDDDFTLKIEKADAIYQLLVGGRESLLRILSDR